MRLLDKLLLFLLVLLLPAGVFLSAKYLKKDGQAGEVAASSEQIAKVEQLIENLSKVGNTQETEPTTKNFELTSVSYASKSAVLAIAGIAPSSTLPIRLSWAEIKDEAVIAELGADDQNGSVLLPLTVRTLMPRNDGSFSILLPVSIEHGMLDIVLEQGASKKYVLYNLDILKIVEEN